MKLIAIMVGKIMVIMGKILKRGSSFPGKYALRIDKNLFKHFKYPKIKIVVTGSSGKGSTSSLIANTLKVKGKVCHNSSGANIDWGVATTLLKYSNLFGKIKTKYLVMEIDERYMKKIIPYLKPNHIVITNLTKDQPPRQHYVDLVYEDIKKCLTPNSTIITNMDDPYLRNFAKDLPNKFVYYSILKNKYSYETQIFENLNIYHCPYCHHKLEYSYYNFETLGHYKCPNCSFKYEDAKYMGTNLDLEKKQLTINKEPLKIGGDMLYNAYNTIAAYACLQELNLTEQEIITSFNRLNDLPSKEFINKDKVFRAISCKAENATTYNQAIFKVYHDKNKKDIIIGWKEISRRYNHFDISWLYDIEFELLNDKSVNKIYACGIDASNIKQRLILSGIPENKIITSENLENIKEEILKSKTSKVYGILNFDYVESFNNTFKKEEKSND